MIYCSFIFMKSEFMNECQVVKTDLNFKSIDMQFFTEHTGNG